MSFLPDRFIRKTDSNLFYLKTLLDQQQGFECRATDIDSLTDTHKIDTYEDTLTSIFYGTTLDELLNRSVFSQPLCTRKIQPMHYREPLPSYKSLVQSKKLFETARVLDTPGLVSDFYSSPLSCHPKKPQTLAIALGPSVYIHNLANTTPREICDFENVPRMLPKTLKWISHDTLALGAYDGSFQCYDVAQERLFRKFYTHPLPHVDCHISSIAVREAGDLFVGNNSSDLVNIDLRASHPNRMLLNIGPICSLAYRNEILLAGGGDNVVHVYDTRHMEAAVPLFSLAHLAGVRALCFLPDHNDLFLTGGGLNDKNIRLFDIKKDKPLFQVNVHAQVSNILALGDDTFISTHGNGAEPQMNSVIQWQYKAGRLGQQRLSSPQILGTCTQRIIYADRCAQGNEKQSFLTVSANNTLQVWKRKTEHNENDDKSWLNKTLIR